MNKLVVQCRWLSVEMSCPYSNKYFELSKMTKELFVGGHVSWPRVNSSPTASLLTAVGGLFG